MTLNNSIRVPSYVKNCNISFEVRKIMGWYKKITNVIVHITRTYINFFLFSKGLNHSNTTQLNDSIKLLFFPMIMQRYKKQMNRKFSFSNIYSGNKQKVRLKVI